METDTYYVKNLFQIGSYEAVLSGLEGSTEPLTPELVYLGARSYLALMPPKTNEARTMLSNLQYPESVGGRSISLLIDVIAGQVNKDLGLSEIERLLKDTRESGAESIEISTAFKVLATAYILLNREESSLVLELIPELTSIDQESLGLAVHALLLQGKHLQAERLVKESDLEDSLDSMQSQLFDARMSLFTGPTNRYQSALYVYEEIKGMQGGANEGSLTGVPVAEAALGQYDQSQKELTSLNEQLPGTASYYANEYVLALKRGKSLGDADLAMAQLQEHYPTHDLSQKYNAASAEFDAAFERFETSTEA